MEKRIAILGIIIEDTEVVSKVNELLHRQREYIIGRMGMPYKEKNISVISIVMDAPNDVISALSGKLGMLEGVSAKAVYSKKQECEKQKEKTTYKADRKAKKAAYKAYRKTKRKNSIQSCHKSEKKKETKPTEM